jgi:hypothetical protein
MSALPRRGDRHQEDFALALAPPAQRQKKNKPVVENGPRLREIGGEETRA